jgi:hypothetical protein
MLRRCRCCRRGPPRARLPRCRPRFRRALRGTRRHSDIRLPPIQRRQQSIREFTTRLILRIGMRSNCKHVRTQCIGEVFQRFFDVCGRNVLALSGYPKCLAVFFLAAPVGSLEGEAAGAHYATLRSAPAGPPSACSQVVRCSSSAPSSRRGSSVVIESHAQLAARARG